MELLYEETDRDLRDKDIWVGEMVEELKEELQMKELEWIKEKEGLNKEIEALSENKEVERLEKEFINKNTFLFLVLYSFFTYFFLIFLHLSNMLRLLSFY